MLKVAVSASGASTSSTVPALFEDATHLMIVDADTDDILQVIDGANMDNLERSLFFAWKAVEFDCEALLCGEMEPEPFAVVAIENSVTRYMAAGHPILESVHLMNQYALGFVTDHIGGTGCPDADPANCELHDHDHDHDHDH